MCPPDFPGHFYDIVHSRDVILHIEDKVALFRHLYYTLKPGGTIMVTDYAKGDMKEFSQVKKKKLPPNQYR